MAALLTAVLAVSSCSQPSGSHHGGQGSHSSSSASASASAGGKTPTGTQLGSLLTNARLPAGWGPITSEGNPEDDSGSALDIPSGPLPGDDVCTQLGPSVTALGFISWWSVSYATYIIQYNPDSASGSTPYVTLTIGAYQSSADASKAMSTATSLADGCRSFTDNTGDSDTVSTATVPQISSQSLYLSSTAQTQTGPLVAQVLVAEVGNYVVGVDTNTGTGGNVSQATVEQMGTLLAGLVQSGA